MFKIEITEDMYNRAVIESKKRNPYINHHFELGYFSGEKRDLIGFLGEFACCKMFGIDWRENIRDNYYSIDNGDIVLNGNIIDVKTETLPFAFLQKLLTGTINDDKPYGRRLINNEQIPLLRKYSAVIFGAFSREDCQNNKFPHIWYALGYAYVNEDLCRYSATKRTPFGTEYPTPVIPYKTSELRDVCELIKPTEQS